MAFPNSTLSMYTYASNIIKITHLSVNHDVPGLHVFFALLWLAEGRVNVEHHCQLQGIRPVFHSARRERLAWAWNVNSRREFSRSHYSIHPVSVKTIIVLSFSLSRKHVIINYRSFLLLCVVLPKTYNIDLWFCLYPSTQVQTKTWWIREIFKKRGTFSSYFNLVEN